MVPLKFDVAKEPSNDDAVTIPVATIPVELTVTPTPALTLKLRLLLLWSYIIHPTSIVDEGATIGRNSTGSYTHLTLPTLLLV